ncbi:DUF3303 domain-containing protein [Actinomadura soli]|uniref:DUF3303 domain-containing protein n=2 Tax=Actinomadura soli TaxID=2508997 RepID=A0A5C4J169_9ACTN|nr:DUF3303 domain-containing protein [Actinomadura soli]
MIPDGLRYIDSWVEPNFSRCFQLMKCDDLRLFQEWVLQWRGSYVVGRTFCDSLHSDSDRQPQAHLSGGLRLARWRRDAHPAQGHAPEWRAVTEYARFLRTAMCIW